MKAFRLNSRAAAIAIAVALVLVLNPEVRALLLLVNALGLEVVALLVFAQARSFWPTIYTGIQRNSSSVCPYALRTANLSLRVAEGLMLSRSAVSNPINAMSLVFSCVQCPRSQNSD